MEKILIYFAQGQHDPLPGEVGKLQSLVDVIEYPDTRITLTGHASAEGSDPKNMELSQKRAESVQAYLIAMGARPSQFTLKALGERQLAVREVGSGAALEALRAKNRRVVVEYVAGKKPSPYQAYIDRLRQRAGKNVDNLERRLRRLEEGEKQTRANPHKVPLVLITWQDEINATRRELDDYRKLLRDLDTLEKALRDPKQVWDKISASGSVFDARVRMMRQLVEDTRRRLEEAKRQLLLAKDPQDRKFWVDVVQEYQTILKDRQDELQWCLKDQQEAQLAKIQ